MTVTSVLQVIDRFPGAVSKSGRIISEAQMKLLICLLTATNNHEASRWI